ncbi:LysM peptidoglycan-binding domain-containing protein [Promicromonospora sp. Populi]|uniref:LysM peptidoglycan-binding domain-containing protein n=1 Tax=Promicromonospora sp. Populi TaxID=3239420 RepID=UPI0034E1D0D7
MSTSTAQGRSVAGGSGAPRRGTGARVVRGLGAALLLIALVVGIPIGLWLLGGPVWTGPVSLDRVIMTLTSPDVTGSVLLGLVKVVGWIAWLTFAIAVVIEVIAALRGRHSPHVRGLGAQQRAAAVLVGAVITMLVAAPSVAPAMAATTPVELAETGTVVSAPVSPGAGVSAGVSAAAETTGRAGADEAPSATYTVQPGDSLWRIAEQTLGDGARFKQIADLNYGVPQPDGGALDAGNWIEPGWVLRLPAGATGGSVEVTPTSTDDPIGIAPSKSPADEPADDGTVDVRNPGAEGSNDVPEGAVEIVIESGDTLWDIAEEELGEGIQYPEIYEASRNTEQPGGMRLTDPDYILPGWTVTVPGAAEATPEPGTDEAPADDAPADDASSGAEEPSAEPSATPDASPSGSSDPTPDDGASEAGATPSATPSTEVTPEGAVEVDPDDVGEPGGSGNDVVEEGSGDQPSDEQPAGEAPSAAEPNRVGQNAPPKESDSEQDSANTSDPADAGTGTAGLSTQDPAPEETAEGILVPQAPPAPRDAPEPLYDEVTPEDLQNDPNLEPDEPASQGGGPDESIPGEGLIADELFGQSLMPQGEPEEPAAEETSSGSGTTSGSAPESEVAGTDATGTDVTGTAVGGVLTEEVLPDEIDGDDPVVGEGAPEVAIESSAAVGVEPDAAASAGPVAGPVAAAGASTAGVGIMGASVASVASASIAGAADVVGAASGGEESLLDSATDVVSDVVSDIGDELEESVGIRTAAGIGALLAAGLIALVAVKRLRARKGREPGETVVVPGPDTPAGALERDLRTVEDPFGRSQVDRALRSLAQWHRERDLPLPGVRIARLKSGEFVELYLDRPADLPEPWASTTDRFVWQLAAGDAEDASRVGSVAGPAESVGIEADGEAPYPALVTVGHDDEDTHLMLDLENLACLDIRGTDADAQATLAALAIELATSLWADDLQVTVVGALGELPGVVDTGRVRHVASLAGIIRELEARADDVDRTLAQVGATSVADARGRGLATDAWTPEILLVGERLGLAERAKLESLVERVPGVGIAAVTSSAEVGDWVLDLTGELTNGDTTRGILTPAYVAVRPQQLDAATYAQALALLAEPETAPGPTWSRSIDRTEPTLEEIPMDVVRAGAADSDVGGGHADGLAPTPGYVSGPSGGSTAPVAVPAGFAPWATAAVSVATPPLGTPVVSGVDVGSRVAPAEVTAPVVRVLGSVELAGTTGVELPTTHQRQATELIAFLAFHPGSRGSDISKALWPSREPNLATRRSAVSRARRWLGTDPSGHEHLPRYWSTDDGGQADLESAGYRLRGVRTDWHLFCDLVGPDLSQTPTPDLLAALDMVRGRPFEGVPLRKYAWAEQLMHTISSGVVDVSHEVARRALLAGDVAMARHASQVGRLADPVDERSWRNGIRAEIASGRRDAVGRLVDRLRDHLEQLSMEPEPDTEELLAQVDEQERRRERSGR